MARSRSIGSIYAELTVRDKMSAKLRNAEKSVNRFVKTYAKIGTLAVTGGFAVFAKNAVAAASDMEETLSKTSVVFGDQSDAMKAWASTAAVAFGQSKEQALSAAAAMGNLFVAMGMGGKESADMSRQIVELAGDLASFNNTSPDDAIQALGAALRGESDPIRRYGVLLDDATLKAKAFEMGLYNGKGALTPQSRALAAYNVILEQTKTAQGDFARTSDGLANSSRIIKARLADITAELGEALLPAVNDLVSALNDIDFKQLVADAKLQLGGIAAFINTVIDGIKSKVGDGFDFDETFQKYLAVPVSEYTGTEDQALTVQDNAPPPPTNWFAEDRERAKRARLAREASEKALQDKLEKAAKQAIASRAFEIPEMLKRIEIGDQSDGSVERYQSPADNLTNEYQRRGLSLDASGRNRGIESAARTTEDILKLLQKNFSVRRELRI